MKMNERKKQYYIAYILLIVPCLLFSKNNKYRAIWNDDPATTMTIGWNQYSGAGAVVYYGIKNHGQNVSAYSYSKKVDRKEQFRDMNNEFARLKNLKPDTKYYFFIKDSESKSKVFWFRTAPNTSDKRLSIIAGGDSRNHREGRQNANRLVAKLRPHCVMFGGDMTSNDNSRQWKEWLNDWQLTITSDNQLIPIIPARGNHEYSNGTIMKIFDAPNANVYYGLTIGGNLLRAYTLNSLIAPGGNQSKWLELDLKINKNAIWKMAQYHHPIRPHTSRKSEKQKQYSNWANLFYKYQVQLVVECDAHVCKTTYPIRPSYEKGHVEGFIRDDKKGTVYVGEGCWGAPLRPNNDDKNWTRSSGSFNQIKWIWVDKEKIEIRTVKTNNAKMVRALSMANIFKVPKNINLWKPKTGSVVRIFKKKKPKRKQEIVKKPIKQKQKTNKAKERKISKAYTKRKNKFVLGDFKVKTTTENIEVKWLINSCPNGVVCEVQRSGSRQKHHFKTFATINLKGSKGLASYELEDDNRGVGGKPFVYYRLKNKLPNGKINYSKIQVTLTKPWTSHEKITTAGATSIYLEYTLTDISDITINVFNEKGGLTDQKNYPNQVMGSHIRTLTKASYKRGKYLVEIRGSTGFLKYLWFEQK
ncbi:MAG: fibronectin type III domain-containing protein [Saprospiraceae bacterium]